MRVGISQPRRAAGCLALWLIVLLAASLPPAAASAGRPEAAHTVPLFLARVGPAVLHPDVLMDVPSVLRQPSAWGSGDAAVIFLADFSRPDASRERLAAALLAEGAAVLELDTRALRSPTALAGEPIPMLFGALMALWRDQGAGPVVVIGFGEAAAAVTLWAVQEDVAPRMVGESGPRFAAAIALGPGIRAVAAGEPPVREEGWPPRAAILCRLLGDAAEEDASGARRTCLDALAR
jgi:hypothetical protein